MNPLRLSQPNRSFAFPLAVLLLGILLGLLPGQGRSQPAPSDASAAAAENKTDCDPIAFIRDEGMNRSQMAEVFGYLTDVIGPRLTGSPNCRRANEWTRDKLLSWGLTNACLEAWGPFGRGWAVKRFSVQVIEPQAIPLVAWPKAWSHGAEWPIVADAVYLEAKTEADLEKYRGQLKGCAVLLSEPREVPIRFEPLATRIPETNLLRMANAGPASRGC